MMKQQSMIAQRVALILQNIEKARLIHNIKHPVRLVAVSKTKSVSQILEAYDAGIYHFGQNYAQQLEQKHKQLPPDIKWHFIGHLQSNKIKKILVPNLEYLETLDRQSLAEKLNSALEKEKRKLNVLIQVKTSEEETKSGVIMQNVDQLYEFVIKKCPNLIFRGLMTIGAASDSSAFIKLYEEKVRLEKKYNIMETLELSMGMSNDFQDAIKHKSTSVRVGSSIFGERNYVNKK